MKRLRDNRDLPGLMGPPAQDLEHLLTADMEWFRGSENRGEFTDADILEFFKFNNPAVLNEGVDAEFHQERLDAMSAQRVVELQDPMKYRNQRVSYEIGQILENHGLVEEGHANTPYLFYSPEHSNKGYLAVRGHVIRNWKKYTALTIGVGGLLWATAPQVSVWNSIAKKIFYGLATVGTLGLSGKMAIWDRYMCGLPGDKADKLFKNFVIANDPNKAHAFAYGIKLKNFQDYVTLAETTGRVISSFGHHKFEEVLGGIVGGTADKVETIDMHSVRGFKSADFFRLLRGQTEFRTPDEHHTLGTILQLPDNILKKLLLEVDSNRGETITKLRRYLRDKDIRFNHDYVVGLENMYDYYEHAKFALYIAKARESFIGTETSKGVIRAESVGNRAFSKAGKHSKGLELPAFQALDVGHYFMADALGGMGSALGFRTGCWTLSGARGGIAVLMGHAGYGLCHGADDINFPVIGWVNGKLDQVEDLKDGYANNCLIVAKGNRVAYLFEDGIMTRYPFETNDPEKEGLSFINAYSHNWIGRRPTSPRVAA